MTGSRGDLDLAATLRAVGAAPSPPPVLEALFFHRTLARWLGLPEGVVDGVVDPVQWEYGWWRADLIHEGDDTDGRAIFCAHLAKSGEATVETVRWWVKKDSRGRIVAADWLTAPPRLLDDDAPLPSGALDDIELRRLFSDDE
jgi:hypothetical protein